MIDHLGFEVADLERSAGFYDAVFFRARRPAPVRVRARRSPTGTDEPRFWIVARGAQPEPGFGHVALRGHGQVAVDAAYAAGLPAGGRSTARPARARSTARATTRPTCSTPTGCASRSSSAAGDR